MEFENIHGAYIVGLVAEILSRSVAVSSAMLNMYGRVFESVILSLAKLHGIPIF